MKNNQVIDTILKRQSIREYLPEQISDDELEALLLTALRAPSGRNSQPCHVRFVQNKKMLEEMNTAFKEVVGYDTPAYTRWDTNPVYQGAPTLAVIFAENDSHMDAGIMCENICIAAQSMGLGTCIIASLGGLFSDKRGNEFKEKMNIPEDFKFLISIAIGYPNETPPLKPRDETKIEIIK